MLTLLDQKVQKKIFALLYHADRDRECIPVPGVEQHVGTVLDHFVRDDMWSIDCTGKTQFVAAKKLSKSETPTWKKAIWIVPSPIMTEPLN
jgi:hypothetical protein